MMDGKDPRNFSFKGKPFDEMTQEDLDEMRYQRGEWLRHVIDVKEALADSEVDKNIKFNNNLKKKWTAEYDEEIKELRQWMKRVDERIQEILDEYAWREQMELKEIKERIKDVQAEKKERLDDVASANARMSTFRGEQEEWLMNAEEQVDLLKWLIDEREKVLSKPSDDDNLGASLLVDPKSELGQRLARMKAQQKKAVNS